MKKFIPARVFGAVIALGLFGIAFAAQSYSRQSYRMMFFGVNPTYVNGATNPTTVVCHAVFKRRYVNDADANDAEESGAQFNVSVDLLAAPTTQVTVATGGGVTVTHAQLAAIIRRTMEQAGGL